MLGTAIRKSNGVRSCDNTRSISSLSSIEVSLGVVISNSVLVGIGLVLALGLNIRGGLVSWGRLVGSRSGFVRSRGGMVRCRSGFVGRCMVDSRCIDRGMNSMVDYWVSKSMVWNMTTMGDNSTMSMADHMGGHSRGRGSGSKAKKGGNNKSLHFCSIFLWLTQNSPC